MSEKELDMIFRALSHSVRRKLLLRLAESPAMITELAAPFDMSLPAVSKHLAVLESAGLVGITVEGRVHRCSLRAERLKEVEKWLEFYRGFWEETLDSLASYMEEENSTTEEKSRE